MIKHKIIEDKIISYIKAAYQWHKEGEVNPIKDGAGLKMIELEDEILKYFGLPENAGQYLDILQHYGFSNKNINQRAKEIIKVLKKEAEDFLIEPIKKDTNILQEGKNNWLGAQDVLPLIGYDTTFYNIFLFHEVYCRGLCNEEELLSYLNQSKEYDEPFNKKIPYKYSKIAEEKYLKKMYKAKLPYTKEYIKYLKYQKTKCKWDSNFDNVCIEEGYELKEVIVLDKFYITEVEVESVNTCIIKILVDYRDSYIPLYIWCTSIMLKAILIHAKYFSIVSPLFESVNPKNLIDNSFVYNVKQSLGKNIEITDIYIELEQLDDEEDDYKDPSNYIVTNIRHKK